MKTKKSDIIMNEAENLDLDLDLELETEVEAESESNPALDLINALQRGDFNAADQLFQDTLGAKVQDTLDAEKVAVAAQIFDGEEPYGELDDEEDIDIEDHEVSAEVDVDDLEVEDTEEI